MGTLRGMECELFFNSGTYAAPTWAACDAVRDATTDVNVSIIDATRRGSGGWRQNETALKEGTLNVTFVKDKDDPVFMDILAAYVANEAMEIAVADGPDAVGTDWLDAMWKVHSWSEKQGLEDVVNIEAVLGIAPDTALQPNYGSDLLPTTRP